MVPLDEKGIVVIERAMEAARTWCPYLFHGPRCAPGATASKRYGCLGDFKKAWRTACTKAGLPVGRKAGGFVFHHTRNTAATNLRGGGMEESDAMKITGHVTAHVFRHYDLGDVEKLRERLAQSRSYVRSLPTGRKVASLEQRRQQSDTPGKQRVTG